ncbi:MAG: hypothetical protein H0U77_05485 [Nocardioidaceae bacterium]|nr:hypothetical protein [Nocardioidaceae bacterium]
MFVQVLPGRELMAQDADEWGAFRPDILASVAAEHEGGAYTRVLHFTSDEAARGGELKEMPPALRAQMEEMNSRSIGEPVFFDLRDPWLASS